ncbi:MAG: hypothetical protein J0L82_14695 [Deltaproteobacteria bacterium]|jgi:hypothetical protein|nr:hypothetical protein [Deltaproteobacteria bacterium]
MKSVKPVKTVGLKLLLTVILTGVLSAILVTPRAAKAEPMRDFVMSCSYGVLAGTLVGAATLAFSDKPGDNLNKVARGASFGLYAGILLGLYVVYGVPNQEEADIRDQLGQYQFNLQPGRRVAELPRLLISPVMGERGVEGGEVRYSFYRF